VSFRVIIKPEEIEKTTDSGIVLAIDERQEKNAQVVGTVIDIGEDAYANFKPKTEFAGLKVGDKVYYARYAGKGIKDLKTLEEFLVVNDEDIVAKYIGE